MPSTYSPPLSPEPGSICTECSGFPDRRRCVTKRISEKGDVARLQRAGAQLAGAVAVRLVRSERLFLASGVRVRKQGLARSRGAGIAESGITVGVGVAGGENSVRHLGAERTLDWRRRRRPVRRRARGPRPVAAHVTRGGAERRD